MLRARHTAAEQPAGTGSTRGPPATLIHAMQVIPCLLTAKFSLAPPYSSWSTHSRWAHQIYFTEVAVSWFWSAQRSSLKPLLCARRNCPSLLASRFAVIRLKTNKQKDKNHTFHCWTLCPVLGSWHSPLASSLHTSEVPSLDLHRDLWATVGTMVKERSTRQPAPQLYGDQSKGELCQNVHSLTAATVLPLQEAVQET